MKKRPKSSVRQYNPNPYSNISIANKKHEKNPFQDNSLGNSDSTLQDSIKQHMTIKFVNEQVRGFIEKRFGKNNARMGASYSELA